MTETFTDLEKHGNTNNTSPNTSPDPDKNYLEELVGDGKKFKTPEQLARGKYEADVMIERLKTEQAELRNDLEKRLTVEQLMDKIDEKASTLTKSNTSLETTPNESNTNRESSSEQESPNTPTLDDVDRLVRERLEEKEKDSQRSRNVSKAAQALENAWGTNWKNDLADKAKELNVTGEFLEGIAASNPQAFIKIVGADKTQQVNDPNSMLPPGTSVNSNAQSVLESTTGDKYKEWNQLSAMRTSSDPAEKAKYWTPAVQNKLFQLAKEGKIPR